jgi:hypothetical protein
MKEYYSIVSTALNSKLGNQRLDGNTTRDTFLDDLGPSPSPQVENAIGQLDRHYEYLNMVINLNPVKSI